ncbi:MAG: S1-like domain-containing RNA-binding protein [Flavobacteriaceae bacterium]|jgi:predicted RNA-binding protein (virulence factor B family)|nr:GntR family transcriptional regulator [Flavobacteriaceae bacterium]MDB2494869.1 S1-like domain-containing RNA-binding protein [Flavobacteriaceae bacterium]MDG1327117.1 S1-like domain-containing RNA-binding protein [Flavobacteriaceae bacterium]MDG1790420.1 S1-like domain-containing RNA-binding protein [Flavobacteriaceae bacterium]MDG2447956.1 S1-like domain-containing RNA-binding protein [Flavobacteriaceae bacterium]|tara:strand:- start:1388 stop:2224 length:837 start_codon:yes stop_codon:yes gene_type:complete
MFEIGKYTTLKILRETEPGLYLGCDSEVEEVILLPHKYKPESYAIGDELKVFIYLDYEERPIATTLEPFVQLHSFGFLRCADVTKHGAFMDWGLEKHLFVSFKEQARPMKVNNWYIVYLYLDEQTNRLAGSSKTNQFLQNDRITVETFDEVEILVTHLTEKGANVIINGQHKGLIYMEDIFEDLRTGDRLKAYIKKIRDDHKIDVVLQKQGYRSIEPNAQYILDELKTAGGFLSINDKSSPETIKELLGLSKKSFKKAVGSLYKDRLILFKEDGIELV